MEHEVRPEKGGVRVLIKGDIDLHVSPQLRDVLSRILDGKPALFVIDLADVPFVDSSAVATIVGALKRVRQWSGSLRVENCQEAVHDTFDIAGLTKILGIE
jgi:anti-sigma B factor antagonist